MKELIKSADEKMIKSIDSLKSEFATVRAGRANPSILNKISVDYYGTPTPINQIAAISVPDPKTIVIQPWDASVLKEVEKAIQTSDLGINPANDGKILRIIIPPLTEERRKALVKDIHKIAENSKVAIRNIRRDFMDKLKAMKKDSAITEDELKDGENQLQKTTDKFIKAVDDALKEKEQEILTV